MEFLSRYFNPFRPPTRCCSMCGRPSLHQMRREGIIEELCCNCYEAVSDEVCLGHAVAGSETEDAGGRIHILTVDADQMARIWNVVSCSIHGVCVPHCLQESGGYGCCRLCGDEAVACPERCQL